MKNKFYIESVGSDVSQVSEIKGAKDYSDAKRIAFDLMNEGDIIAECPPSAVKTNNQFPEFHFIKKDECENYAKLCCGTWATMSNGEEYFEEYAWYFDDLPEQYFDGDGNEFTDWKDDVGA